MINKQKEMILNTNYANILALALAIVIIFIPSRMLASQGIYIASTYIDMIFVISVFAVFTVLHELIHVAVLRTKTKDVGLGFMLMNYIFPTPYTKFSGKINVGRYRTCLLMPTLILVSIPAILGIIYSLHIMLLMATVMFIGGVGDMLVFIRILYLPKDQMVGDHKTKMGVILYD